MLSEGAPIITHPAQYVGRFAPSPTGPLHAGSLYSAVISWLDARAAGGRLLLRIEDIDRSRIMPGAADAIRRTLTAHGLFWDEEMPLQSMRGDAYEAALAALAGQGLLFHCTCTRRALRAAGGSYPGTCRAWGLDKGRGPAAIRMRVDASQMRIEDRLMGHLNLPPGGDFVIRRRDGVWAYQLAVVVDDGAQGVTHVVRGDDLLDSTPPQLLLRQALGLPQPSHLHHKLVSWPDGTKLSKQTAAPAVDDAQAPANLAQTLACLHLPGNARLPVAEQLAQALTFWRPSTLPRQDTILARSAPLSLKNS